MYNGNLNAKPWTRTLGAGHTNDGHTNDTQKNLRIQWPGWHDSFHWNCYNPKSTKSKKPRFLGISRDKFTGKLRFWLGARRRRGFSPAAALAPQLSRAIRAGPNAWLKNQRVYLLVSKREKIQVGAQTLNSGGSSFLSNNVWIQSWYNHDFWYTVTVTSVLQGGEDS